MRLLACLAAGALSAGLAAVAQAAPRYVLDAIPGPAAFPDHRAATVDGFNDRGQVLVTTRLDSGFASLNLYTPGRGLEVLDPGPRLRIGHGLNERGEVPGLYDLSAWVFRTGGAGSPIPGVSDVSSEALAINDAGLVVGHRDVSGPFWHSAASGTTFIPVRDGRAVDVNDLGVVLVSGDAPGQPHWLYDTRDGRTTVLDHGARLGLRGWLNDAGDVAFQEVGPWNGDERVKLWRGGGLQDVPGLAGSVTDQLLDFNDAGWLLGRSSFAAEAAAGFLNVPGEGTFALGALIDPASRAGWSALHAFQLNDAGDIAGWGVLDGRQRLFVLDAVAAPVPEPAPWLLLSIGGGLVAARVRRRHPRA